MRAPRLRLGTRCGALLLALLAGCGYAIGPSFSPEVRSVYVPVFSSGSYRRGYEYQLTEAVQRQIKLRTPFRLVEEENADTQLTGRIVSVDKRSLGITPQSDARELQVDFVVEVTWEDLRNREILRSQRVSLPPDVIRTASQAEFAPETGQSLATANQQALDRVATRIVEMMEAPW